jgi:hypothetical protein
MPTQAAVIALVVEAQKEIVEVVKGCGLSILVTPYPFLKITFPSLTTATERPVVFHKGIED